MLPDSISTGNPEVESARDLPLRQHKDAWDVDGLLNDQFRCLFNDSRDIDLFDDPGQ